MSHEPTRPAQPQTPSPAILDAAALARLGELDPDGRRGVVGRVLAAFEASLSRMLVQIESLRVEPDAVALSTVAHTLKSSAASVGALALSQACAEIERRRRGGDTRNAGDDVEALLAGGHAALAAVRAILRP